MGTGVIDSAMRRGITKWDHEEAQKVENLISPLSPNHYGKWKIEPITFIMENDIPFAEGNVIKYVVRHRDKNGLQDINKAIRYLEMIKEHEYGIKSTVLPDGVSLEG